jgi:hypothetical protein
MGIFPHGIRAPFYGTGRWPPGTKNEGRGLPADAFKRQIPSWVHAKPDDAKAAKERREKRRTARARKRKLPIFKTTLQNSIYRDVGLADSKPRNGAIKSQ